MPAAGTLRALLFERPIDTLRSADILTRDVVTTRP